MSLINSELQLCTNMENLQNESTLGSSYEERIRPWLNAVDNLRNLGIMKEGIRLPTIVVVGDQSSGKSSVLESLAGVRLPTGQGICTRVPLIVRLHSSKSDECQISVEYDGKTRVISEERISKTIEEVTLEIAGKEKGVSDSPITLNIRRRNAPDLTMVDLPGITRVPVHGQPANIYEQISAIIKQYISPKESIILNVLSATVDFPTCESIRMSQEVDKNGERTLAVVTKVDRAPEGLYEKVTDDAVNIGLGYVCVRNRLGDESIEDARENERNIFEMDPHLAKLDKTMVGIPILADKLMQIQSMEIAKCLPEIVKKVDMLLSKREAELSSLPRKISTTSEALNALMDILNDIKTVLLKLFRHGEYEGFEEDVEMHGAVNMNKLFTAFSHKLKETSCTHSPQDFLKEELKLLENAQGITLPDFLSPGVFLTLVKRRIDTVIQMCNELVCKVCDYVEAVISRIIDLKTDCYSFLNGSARKAFHKVMMKKRESSESYVAELLDVERNVVFTENPSYSKWSSKQTLEKEKFIEAMDNKKSYITFKGVGEVELTHLKDVPRSELLTAFDMRMKLHAYWNVVTVRLVDHICIHLRYSALMLIENEISRAITDELPGPKMHKMEDMLDESPMVASKRKNLKSSVECLKQAKNVVGRLLGHPFSLRFLGPIKSSA